MRYGHFDDKRREYVVDRPDTPTPWINYLGVGGGDYCAIISNNAGGYSFYQSPGENRILRFRFNAVPEDRPGRYVYLRDEKGDYWSNSWAPVRKPLKQHKTVCRHGMGYTRIESRYKGIASSVTYLVPPGEPLEVWCLEVTNRTKNPRTLDAFTYAEFAFPFFAGENSLQAILFCAQTRCVDGIIGYSTPVPGWRFTDRFFAATAAVRSFDTRREAFIGPWRSEADPLAVERGQCSNDTGAGGNACGSLQVRIELQPGETKRICFICGQGAAETDGVRARQTYTPERFDEELARIRALWGELTGGLQCKTPDPAMDSMINVWNAYQAHVNFRWSRSASYIEAGLRDGYGYRDTLQDTLGVMHARSDEAREAIVQLLRGQASDGAALHKVQPLTLVTGQGETIDHPYSDDHLWIPLAVAAYVRETGDLAFCDREIEYLDTGSATVVEHMRSALRFAREHRGAHGLLLSLAADWNDALQLGEGGESVWVSMQFCKAAADFAELADALERPDAAAEARAWAAEMADAVNRHAWDGDWYLRAMMANGSTAGSRNNDVARVWLNPQTWSVIAGVATPQRAKAAMEAVHTHLASEYGLHLFTPPHVDLTRDVVGRVSYPPGFKENGAIFCHPNPWAMIAAALQRDGERAFAYYRSLLPSTMNDRADHRRCEPYVYTQFVTGKDDPQFGVAHNPWVTGTAGWCYVAGTQYLLGIRPTLSGLRIDPCIPADWKEFRVTRLFRGATYDITVRNPGGRSSGVRSLTVNGRKVDGDVLPVAEAGAKVKVVAVLGE